ncbi:hypothetical protein DFJ77DRAFT_451752 [Powellomyces hirtus]|nr:hypothetical protein DFJ77DRAFT_451752 [Powellomyces hirtus]
MLSTAGTGGSTADRLAGLEARHSRGGLVARRIQFFEVPPTNDASSSSRAAQLAKYKQAVVKAAGGAKKNNAAPALSVSASDGIPAPTTILFDPAQLSHTWKRNHPHPTGLDNRGNLCFANATLQKMAATPMLANYVVANPKPTDHPCVRKSNASARCLYCMLKDDILTILGSTSNGHAAAVRRHHRKSASSVIARNMATVGTYFTDCDQHDAHEFGARLIEEVNNQVLLRNHKDLDVYSKETTLLEQIFGGYARSQIVCGNCQHVSARFDVIHDVSLVLHPHDHRDLTTLLHESIQPEKIDGYRCDKCSKTYPTTQKATTLHRLPRNITIHLQRFSGWNVKRGRGKKIHSPVTYPEILDFAPYTSHATGPARPYQLYAVTLHHGTQKGHYLVYVRGSDNKWSCRNDADVLHDIALKTVLGADREVYMLHYREMTESYGPIAIRNDRTTTARTSTKKPDQPPPIATTTTTTTSPHQQKAGKKVLIKSEIPPTAEAAAASASSSSASSATATADGGKLKRRLATAAVDKGKVISRSAVLRKVKVPPPPKAQSPQRTTPPRKNVSSSSPQGSSLSAPAAGDARPVNKGKLKRGAEEEIEATTADAVAPTSNPITVVVPASSSSSSQPHPPPAPTTITPTPPPASKKPIGPDRTPLTVLTSTAPSHPHYIAAPASTNPNYTPLIPRRPNLHAPTTTPTLDPQYGAPVQAWASDLSTHVLNVRRDRIIQAQKPRVRRADGWDKTYDEGKRKKVRTKK